MAAQVSFPSLQVTSSRALGSPSIPMAAPMGFRGLQVTRFPRPGLGNYRYLRCSRTLGSGTIAIYSVPAPWAREPSLFTVFPHPGLGNHRYLQCSRTLGSPSIAVYSVPALAQVGLPSLSITKV